MTLISSFARKWLPAIIVLALAAPLAAQEQLAADLAQYERETDPARKARALSRLSEVQLKIAQQQLKSGQDVASLDTLQLYLHEVQQTMAALKATRVDPEKKPSGFKELQISIRESVRRIDDLILTLPVDKRPFFRSVRTDLVAAQNELIDALFPRRPARDKANP